MPRGQRTGRGRRRIIPPRQIIAEVDDDFPRLAEKLGIDTQDLVQANPDTSRVSAGAVYNVPTPTQQPPLDWWLNAPPGSLPVTGPRSSLPTARSNQPDPIPYLGPTGNTALPPGVGVGAGIGDLKKPEGMTWFEYLNSGLFREQALKEAPTTTESFNVIEKELQSLENFDFYDRFPQWMKDLFPSIGGGAGAGIGGGFQPPLPDTPLSTTYQRENPPGPPTDLAEQADFRQAQADAAFRDRETRLFSPNVLEPEVGLRRMLEGLGNIPGETMDAILDSNLADMVRSDILEKYPEAVAAAQDRPGREDITLVSEGRQGLDDIRFRGEEGFVPPKDIVAPTAADDELLKLKIPENPSAFEAVNWLTGAGLTGTALLMAGRQLRLDRPEYWDATGVRSDVLEGMEKFLIAEFGTADGEIDWNAAYSQDPYILDTLDKLGYLDNFGIGGAGAGSAVYGGKYNYRSPVYTQSSRRPTSQSRSSSMGLVSWSI